MAFKNLGAACLLWVAGLASAQATATSSPPVTTYVPPEALFQAQPLPAWPQDGSLAAVADLQAVQTVQTQRTSAEVQEALLDANWGPVAWHKMLRVGGQGLPNCDWGLDKLAKKEYEESIGEMKHADQLMDSIFMLDGLPNLQDMSKLLVGENVPEALACDLKSEMGSQVTIKAGIAHCETVHDFVSRDLPKNILHDTEEHIDFLETQIDLIDKVGLQNYLQSQMGELS